MGSDVYRQRLLEATRTNWQAQNDIADYITQLYREAAEDIRQITIEKDGTLTQRWADTYGKALKERIGEVWRSVDAQTDIQMRSIAETAMGVQTSILGDAAASVGLDISKTWASVFGNTPDAAVAYVKGGGMYAGPKATLSQRIWSNADIQNGQIERIIAKGIAEKQSPMQLAKALEVFVNPDAALESDWNDIYEDLPFTYTVDYNAKRLATTAINHAYFASTIMTARDNPFADYLHWELSLMHSIYDICDLHAEHDEGLGLGNFSIDNAPVPHPWCTCNWYIDTDKSLEEIGRELYEWEQGGSNDRLDAAFGKWQGEHSAQATPFVASNRFQKQVNGYTLQSDNMPNDEIINMVVQAADTVARDFPLIKPYLHEIQFAPIDGAGGFALNRGKMLIRLDNTVFSSYATAMDYLNQAIAIGHTTKNVKGPEFIIAHELGHAVQNAIALRNAGYGGKPLYMPQQAERVKQHVDGISKGAYLAAFERDKLTPADISAVTNEMGWRGTENGNEFLAQSVAMYYYGTGKHPIADDVMEFLIAFYKMGVK